MNTDKSEFCDQQILKLQEAPELIPTGEMPRNVMLTVDRDLTDKCTPGNRVKIMGILSISKKQNNADSNSNK
jgi:DNA replication licensing factor MCM5